MVGSTLLEQYCCLQGFLWQDFQMFEPFDLNIWFPFIFKDIFILELARGLLCSRKNTRDDNFKNSGKTAHS